MAFKRPGVQFSSSPPDKNHKASHSPYDRVRLYFFRWEPDAVRNTAVLGYAVREGHYACPAFRAAGKRPFRMAWMPRGDLAGMEVAPGCIDGDPRKGCPEKFAGSWPKQDAVSLQAWSCIIFGAVI